MEFTNDSAEFVAYFFLPSSLTVLHCQKLKSPTENQIQKF